MVSIGRHFVPNPVSMHSTGFGASRRKPFFLHTRYEKLGNLPSFVPTKCATCGRTIALGEDGFSVKGNDYFCEQCWAKQFGGRFPR